MTDGRIGTLNKADLANVDAAQRRYQHIATTIDDAVAKLQRIVDADSDGLRGQYVAPLQKDAAAIKDSLSKAATRYNDVASEIKKYEPELSQAKDDVRAALAAGEDADASLSAAKSMPDPQKAADGTVTPEEQQKATDKQGAQDEAGAAVTAAKNRLTAALDALDVAGKRLGDAVNAKNYDDGLSDTLKDKVLAVLKMVSKVFAVIALVLAVLAFVIPGMQAIAIAAMVAAAVILVSDSVLYAYGEAEIKDVVLDALGLVAPGFGAAVGKLAGFAGKAADAVSGTFKGLTGAAGKIKPAVGSWTFNPGGFIKPGGVIGPIGTGTRPGLFTPRPAFFETPWTGTWDAVKGFGAASFGDLRSSWDFFVRAMPTAGPHVPKDLGAFVGNSFGVATGIGVGSDSVHKNGSLLTVPHLSMPGMNLPETK